jgi:hypothetical protein
LTACSLVYRASSGTARAAQRNPNLEGRKRGRKEGREREKGEGEKEREGIEGKGGGGREGGKEKKGGKKTLQKTNLKSLGN